MLLKLRTAIPVVVRNKMANVYDIERKIDKMIKQHDDP